MNDKSKELLRLALRYVLYYSEMSPAILSEEWHVSEETAIDICSQNLAQCVVINGMTGKDFKKAEKEILKQIIDLAQGK